MDKALDSLHNKILKSKFAEEVTEVEIAALVKAKGISCGDCSRRKWYQIGYEDGKNSNNWIPCSESLPEEHGEYLVWWTDLTGNKYYEITEYLPGEGWIGTIPQAFGEYKVIAWMPLPEPCKESE